MKRISLFIALFIGLNAFAQQDEKALKYAATITSEELSEHLHILASDEYEGRETGRKGQKMAADYIKVFYDSTGIPPLGDDYYQVFPIEVKQTVNAELSLNGNPYTFLKDFYMFPGNYENMEAKEVLFLGYGIDDKNYSDYEGQDVKDKVLLVLGGEPFNKGNRVCEKEGWASNYRLKRNAARDKGAKALLVINEKLDESIYEYKHFITKPSTKLVDKDKGTETDMLMAYVSTDVADRALMRNGTSVKKIAKKIKKTQKSERLALGSPFAFSTEVKEEKLTGENVMGFIEGTDKKMS